MRINRSFSVFWADKGSCSNLQFDLASSSSSFLIIASLSSCLTHPFLHHGFFFFFHLQHRKPFLLSDFHPFLDHGFFLKLKKLLLSSDRHYSLRLVTTRFDNYICEPNLYRCRTIRIWGEGRGQEQRITTQTCCCLVII